LIFSGASPRTGGLFPPYGFSLPNHELGIAKNLSVHLVDWCNPHSETKTSKIFRTNHNFRKNPRIKGAHTPGSLSNVVETASTWYKSQEHFSPVDLDVFQTVGNAFQRFDLGITALGKAIACPVFKVIQYRVSPVLQSVTTPYELTIICKSEVENEIVQDFGCLCLALLPVNLPYLFLSP